MTNEELIRARFPNSRFHVEDGIKTWKNTHDWKIVEREMNLIVWFDESYGLLALTDGVKVESGNLSIVTNDVVILDKNYYGTKKYIWR